MEAIDAIIKQIDDIVWGIPLIVILLACGIMLTVRLRFLQIRKLGKGFRYMLHDDDSGHGDVSSFAALCTALSATVGTGNIVGVATAVSTGGAGALFWMEVAALFGMATKYAEGLLAIKYRTKDQNGNILGGPFYYIEKGLGRGWKWLAVLFAIFTAIAAFGIGNTVQANAIATVASESYGISPYISGAFICVMTAAVVLGGVKSIARVCSMLVPLMAAFYVLGCLYILCVNAAYLWPALCLIVKAAFSPEAAGGGFIGSTVMMAARFGIARGLFSNESGMGSAPIVAAAAQTRNPVRQALVSSSGTFWDTVVICALTGLVIVSSVLAYPDIDFSNGATLT